MESALDHRVQQVMSQPRDGRTDQPLHQLVADIDLGRGHRWGLFQLQLVLVEMLSNHFSVITDFHTRDIEPCARLIRANRIDIRQNSFTSTIEIQVTNQSTVFDQLGRIDRFRRRFQNRLFQLVQREYVSQRIYGRTFPPF